jgi:hypothetical protein
MVYSNWLIENEFSDLVPLLRSPRVTKSTVRLRGPAIKYSVLFLLAGDTKREQPGLRKLNRKWQE